MKLTGVTVHKYKSYDQQQSFPVHDDITIIVGKNESGKTAILEAIAKTNYFSDDGDFKFNPTHDYPRKEKKKYDKSGEIGNVISCTYLLEQEEISEIEKYLEHGVISEWEFTVTTKYDNSKIITFPNINTIKFLEIVGNKYNLNAKNLDILKSLISKEEIIDAINEHKSEEYDSEKEKLSKALLKMRGFEGRTVGIGRASVAAPLRIAGFDATIWSTLDDMAHQPNEYAILKNIIDDALVMACLMNDLQD